MKINRSPLFPFIYFIPISSHFLLNDKEKDIDWKLQALFCFIDFL